MTAQPPPGEVLNCESVRLLLPGDRLRRDDGVNAVVHFEHRADDELVHYVAHDIECGMYAGHADPERFTFVERPQQPSGGQDGGGVDTVEAIAADVLKLCDGHPHAKIAWPHRPLHDIADRLQALASPAKATGWQGIETHDNSRNPVLVEDAKGKRVMAWRNHPSSRTDTWLTVPGSWQVKPVRFFVPPPSPTTPIKAEDHE